MLPLTGALDHLSKRTNGIALAAAPSAEEAPAIFKHGAWFYLFTSWNHDNEHYQVHVTRSSTHNGDYVGPEGILGIGGQDTFVNDDGSVYLVYHYKIGSPAARRVDSEDMSSGWPVVGLNQ
ncbi:hypothetical protein B0H11DRAFT_1922732 [Mycena galericulata]|nr:hypothetical protein B0H11DRAFT_1922732 [Mycena galericulata]